MCDQIINIKYVSHIILLLIYVIDIFMKFKYNSMQCISYYIVTIDLRLIINYLYNT